jgi:hypothetical protein
MPPYPLSTFADLFSIIIPRTALNYKSSILQTPSLVKLLPMNYGDEGTRTPDLLRAREALSHLSYIPKSTF